MYEIWSLGEQPYTNLTNNEVSYVYAVDCCQSGSHLVNEGIGTILYVIVIRMGFSIPNSSSIRMDSQHTFSHCTSLVNSSLL